MRRVVLIVLAVALLAAAGLYAWQTYGGGARPAETEARKATVVRQDIENTVNVSGNVSPETEWSLSFTTPGTVATVSVTAGDRVVAGQTLATLDTVDLRMAVAQAQQAVSIQELNLAKLKAGPNALDVAAAQAALSAAQARLAQARRGADPDALASAKDAEALAWNAYLQADTQRNAVQDNPLTPVDERAPYDASAGMASVNYQIARHQHALAAKPASASAVAAARAQVAQAQASLDRLLAGAASFDLQSAGLQLTLAQSKRDRAQWMVDQAVLAAPHTGIVTAVYLDAGLRTPSDKPAVVVIDDSAYHLDLPVDEIDVGRLAVGQPVTVTLDALPDVSLRARIADIAAVPGNLAGVVSFQVRVDLLGGDPRLRAGMTANALIVTEHRNATLVVPNWSVRIDRTSGQAYVPVQRGDKVEEVAVTLGLRNETVSEVLSGLSEGDQIVVTQERTSLFGNP